MTKNQKVILAIDATRNKSGGAILHIENILNHFNTNEFIFSQIHLFSYDILLDEIPNYPWLIKHEPPQTKKNIILQLYWQKYIFPKQLKNIGCNLLFSTSGGSLCRFKPYVTMSRELLSFSPKVLKRYQFSLRWLRLILLRYIQLSSFKNAKGIIFLNEYAFSVISSFQKIKCDYTIVNHGVSQIFNFEPTLKKDLQNANEIVVSYVSNAELYKNIDQVIKAVYLLIQETKLPYKLKLLGAKNGNKKALQIIYKYIRLYDPNLTFVEITDRLSHQELVDYLSQTDIIVFVSAVENMPNTLIEGMACKLPIVCSNVSPMPETIGDAALFVNPENPEEIKNAILKYTLDYNLRVYNSLNAFENSKKFSWEKTSKDTFTYLQHILNNHNSPTNVG